MANIKSAKKRVITSAKSKEANNTLRSSMRTAIKKLEKLITVGDKTAATEELKAASKKIDKAATKGIVHSNFANRQKARLSSKVNKIEK